MLTLHGFSACIESNGAPLPEYLVSVDEKASRVSCWIPGVEGQSFKVNWSDEGSKVSTCAFIILDGVVVPGRFLHGEGAVSRGGVRVSKTTERPFVFSKVKQTDSGVKEDSKEAGLIVLKIKRIKCITPRAPNPIQAVPSTGALGMRKEGDLCIGFGDEIQVDAQHGATWEVSSFESDKPGVKPRTYVSFVFRYRSPEFLDAQGIASMEQTQPWVAHTSRFTRRTVSLPIPVPILQENSEFTVDTPLSSAVNTPLIDREAPMFTREGFQTEMGPPPTPASLSSDLNSSPEQLIGQLPLLASRDSTPALSESDVESTRRSSAPTSSSPTESEPDKSASRLGKGKAPVVWRPWIHPNSRPADPRRTLSWKLPRINTENGSSSRSVRGVERPASVNDNVGPPHVFEGAFMVTLPRHTSTTNSESLLK